MHFCDLRTATALVCASFLASCGAGGVDGSGESGSSPPPPPPAGPTGRLATSVEAGVFLGQATFGPSPTDLESQTGRSASEWFIAQTELTPTYLTPVVNSYIDLVRDPDSFSAFRRDATSIAFWRNAVGAPDQLRQRMAFALSQILVVSDDNGPLRNEPEAMAYYQDILIEHALGNYRDLLEAVTYSPAMGSYLTYVGSKKENPDTGRMPDENYARELLQLFTLGVVEINAGGEVVTGGDGLPIELFDNTDITGLARVFTGYEFALDRKTAENRRARLTMPLVVDPEDHSLEEKSFLGLTIPAGIGAEESLDRTLDHLMDQPTMAPFLARQLIQRFTTSNPSPDYVRRVAQAFETGSYQLPNFVTVGTGQTGDLTATLAAILFDETVTDVDRARTDESFGKIREPVLRLVHWARAFQVPGREAVYMFDLYDTNGSDELNQNPYRAPSVFNFYRPGFIAPGTRTGDQGMTVPELQILNSASVAGYVNFMDDFILDDLDDRNLSRIEDQIRWRNVNLDPVSAQRAWLPDYDDEIALADDHAALVDHLDQLLTHGTLSSGTRALIIEELDASAALNNSDTPEALRDRVQMAILMVMTSPDYLVQR